jgi:hypothetical protein
MENSNEVNLPSGVKEWFIKHCLDNKISVKVSGDPESTEFMHAPISLQPSPFDEEAYAEVT